MGLIKEPIEIDFFVDPRPLTEAEERMISAYIKRERQLKRMIIRKSPKAIR